MFLISKAYHTIAAHWRPHVLYCTCGGHLSGLRVQKSGRKEDIWAAKKWIFERRIVRTFERTLEIGMDIWAEHILLTICDLIQLVPLSSANISHFKLIVLLPAHQRGSGSRILSRIMFNLMKIKSLKVEVKCTKSA